MGNPPFFFGNAARRCRGRAHRALGITTLALCFSAASMARCWFSASGDSKNK